MPPFCSQIFQIKDARLGIEDCESIINEEEDKELCYWRRNPAMEHPPNEQLLEYKVFGLYKDLKDEFVGKVDTHWLTMEQMTEPPDKGGVGLVKALQKIQEYEQRYIKVRNVRFDKALREKGEEQGCQPPGEGDSSAAAQGSGMH